LTITATSGSVVGTTTITRTVNPLVSVGGIVAYYPTSYSTPPPGLSDKRVGNVTMTVTGDTNVNALTATADGSYGFVGFLAAGDYNDARGNYTVTPSKTDDSPLLDGVTSFDQALIQAHILERVPEQLDSPYKLLAADVNGDGNINSFDQAYLQAFILQRITQLPAGLWRFVPANYEFPVPTSPWDAPADRSYAGLVTNVPDGDFVAIKLGEVANNWTAPSLVGSGLAQGANGTPAEVKAAVPGAVFTVSRQSARPGQTVSVKVTVSGFDQVTSAQFSLAWDPAVLRYAGTGSYGLKGLSDGCFGTTQTEAGKLAFAWYDPAAVGVTLGDGTALFTVTFEVIGQAGSDSAVALAGSPIAPEVSKGLALAAFGAEDGNVSVVGTGVLISNPGYANGVFRLSVPTEQGRSYILEFTDALAAGNWTALPAVAGDGTVEVLVDPAATKQHRFYRVRVQ
jgi:hypothetical protein